MSKHTPGPWGLSHGGFKDSDGFSIATKNDTANNVKIVCECWPCSIVDQSHRDELAANARLIASAPDLLAACIAARQFIVNGIEFGYIRMPDKATQDPAHQTLPAIEAAIAKATR
jgi:hypothetical protein